AADALVVRVYKSLYDVPQIDLSSSGNIPGGTGNRVVFTVYHTSPALPIPELFIFQTGNVKPLPAEGSNTFVYVVGVGSDRPASNDD
ncbi:MAG: hypothetical protein IJI59_00545, partial [Clostridia bacterium]|nr:hypothetical protein [Clostridia bacterium]